MSVDYEQILGIGPYESQRMRSNVIGYNDIAAAMLSRIGSSGSPIDPCANAYQFVTKYGLRVEGNLLGGPQGLDGDYKHLRTIYEDTAHFLVLIAGAQTGKTAALFAHLARICYGVAFGRAVGFYFPDKHLPIAFSNNRFKPFIRSNPILGDTLGAQRSDGSKGQDATLTLTLAETVLYFMTIGGKTATEGLPLKATLFDEVRRMNPGDIGRAQERYSAQRDPVDIKASTARFPDSDIHHYFMQGDQRYFHTACACSDGVVLSQTFPNCIADMRRATPLLRDKVAHAFAHAGLPYLGMTDSERLQYVEAAYICPVCGEILVDPREGWWEPHAGERFIHSYQMPQILSPTFPAGRFQHKFETNEDHQEFMNSGLGLPYLDREKMPIQGEHIDACVNPDLVWGEHLPSNKRELFTNTALGADVQAGYGIVVIKTRAKNGKERVLHLEVARPLDDEHTWWHRLAQLMQRYDVRMGVIDEAPEYSQSLNFAQAFRGRVFLANFGLTESAPRFVQWDDEVLDNDRKQKGDSASRYRVSLDRTRSLHWSLHRWKNRAVEVPRLTALVQTLPLDPKGQPVFSAHLRNGIDGPAQVGMILRDHLTRWVFYDQIEADAKLRDKKGRIGVTKRVAEFVGMQSPDFAMANLYCSVALDRIGSAAGIRELG